MQVSFLVFLSAVSGVCLAVPYFLPVYWWLMTLGVAGMLLVVIRVSSRWQAFLFGWSISSIHTAAALAWWWTVYPLVGLGWSGGVGQVVMIGYIWLLVAAAIGLGGGLAAYVIRSGLERRRTAWWLAVPVLWWLGEMLGAGFFSVLTLGAGSRLGVDFSFGFVGYSLLESSWFDGVAAFGGVYGLSLLLIVVATVLVYGYQYRAWLVPSGIGIAVCGLLLMSNVAISAREAQQFSARVVSIETNFTALVSLSDTEEARRTTALSSAVRLALTHQPDIILLPEDTRFKEQFTPAQPLLAWLAREATSPVLLYDSARTTLPDGSVIQRATVYDTKRQVEYSVDKQYLVPIGEYVPYLAEPMLLASDAKFRHRLQRDRAYIPGPKHTYATAPADVPAVLFCSESVVPNRVGAVRADRKTPLVLHPISHALFHDTELLSIQLRQMLKLQALHNNVTIVQAGNASQGNVAVNNLGQSIRGEVIAETPLYSAVLFDL